MQFPSKYVMFYAANGEDESNDVKIEAIPIGEFLHGQYKVRLLFSVYIQPLKPYFIATT